jgi:excisionase family DNA binding protein
MTKPNNPNYSQYSQAVMTVTDVAELDNVSEKTVRRAIKAGHLEVIRVGPGGRLIRITPAAHIAYRMAQKVGQ